MTDVEEIRALIEQRDSAVGAGDAAGAVVATAPGAIVYDLPPPLSYTDDRDLAVAALNDWFSTWEGGVESHLHDPAIRVDGDLAVVHGLSHMTGVKRGEGPLDVWFRSTLALKRGADGWRIVHEHNSFPMQMDGSGLAATDLRPA